MHISSWFRRSLFFEVQPFFKCKHFSSAGSVIMTGSFRTGRLDFFNVGEGCWWKNASLQKTFNNILFSSTYFTNNCRSFSYIYERESMSNMRGFMGTVLLACLYCCERAQIIKFYLEYYYFSFRAKVLREILNEESYCRLWSRISVFYINRFGFSNVRFRIFYKF